jgi:AcrR family transcriptional regulator
MVRTRAALRDALLVLLEQKAFDQINIRDIAAQSGTGYATFFRHYETKVALLDDVAADLIGNLIGLSLPVLLKTDNTRDAARAVCRYVQDNRKIWTALLTGGAAGTMREEFLRQARQIPTMPAKHTTWLPDDLKMVYGVGATVEILAWWLRSAEGYGIEEVAEILDRLVISPTLQTD